MLPISNPSQNAPVPRTPNRAPDRASTVFPGPGLITIGTAYPKNTAQTSGDIACSPSKGYLTGELTGVCGDGEMI
ncbi:hypothetical protein GCM10027256_24980 [Novispirillum itersonii subsp. nipponicum]